MHPWEEPSCCTDSDYRHQDHEVVIVFVKKRCIQAKIYKKNRHTQTLLLYCTVDSYKVNKISKGENSNRK